MAVIINELVVRATVTDTGTESKSSAASGAVAVDGRKLVEECVEEVMRILQRENER